MNRSSLGRVIGSVSVALLFMLVIGFVMITADAHGEAGDGFGNSGRCNYYVDGWFDSCYGVTWRKYKWGQRSLTFTTGVATKPTPVVGGTNEAPGGPVGTATVNCTGYSEFYVLGFEVFVHDGSGYHSKGYQRGIVRNKNVTLNGGSYNFRELSDTESWNDVYYKFQKAVENNATNGITEWNSDLGWFCYDPKFEFEPEKERGNFWSRSGVSVDQQGADITAHDAESENNGSVTLKISTNEPKVKVNFYHKMFYSDAYYDTDNSTDTYDDVTSDWTVEWKEDRKGQVDTGTIHTRGKADNSGSTVQQSNAVEIDVPVTTKDPVTVCQRIKYSPTKATMESEQIFRKETKKDDDGKEYEVEIFDHINWKVKNSNSSKGDSVSCIEITRPEYPDDPDDPTGDKPGPTVGSVGSDVVFAGEDGSVSWKAKAKSYETRRYAALQAITYTVDAEEDYNKDNVTGDKNYKGTDTCSYYRARKANDDCGGEISHSVTNTADSAPFKPDPNPLNQSLAVVIPERVGDKYCASLGYKFEYWWGIDKDGDQEWHREDDKTYWVVFDSVCRTIAKKPSTAVWNSSIFTVGPATASLSPRYNNTALHASPTGNTMTTYGTWSEYLNVVGGEVKGVGSGSTLSGGSQTKDLLPNSPLTISNDTGANSGKLGYSEVPLNGSLRTRLNGYLKNNPNVKSISNPSEIAPSTTQTNIYHLSDNQPDTTFTISNDITYQEGIWYDVYSLPQNIIFVDGNLSIASDVKRIDAWLIVTGTLDTCGDFTNQTSSESTAKCSNQLAINGPVIANSLVLHRSFGSEPNAADTGSPAFSSTTTSRSAPAEIFNLRQDTLLWAYAQANKYGSSYSESYSRELAPRY